MRLPRTINIHVGKKLNDKLKEDISKEVFKVLNLYGVVAIQVAYEVIRVTLSNDEGFRQAKELTGVRLFGLWCPILGGGPPVTVVHMFDYPYEEDNGSVFSVFEDFGDVKKVKDQTCLWNNKIFTGTRLVFMVLNSTLPRSLTIDGYPCRVWYKGQPLICNLCNIQGHKSAVCPNKDKCRRCGEQGHFARNCSKDLSSSREDPVAPPAPSDGAGAESGSGVQCNDQNAQSKEHNNVDVSNENAQSDINMQNVQISENVNEIQSSDHQNELTVEGASVDPVPDLGNDPNVNADAESVEKENGISTKAGCDGVSSLAGATPLVAQGAWGDSNVSPSDSYLFTCGQPMSQDVVVNPNEASDSQCVAAVAHATAVENDVVASGDASSASQSILQDVEPVLSSSGQASREPPPDSSPYGSRELKTKVKSVVSGILQKNRPSPVSGVKPPPRAGSYQLQRSSSHSRLPVVIANRPSSRSRNKKT